MAKDKAEDMNDKFFKNHNNYKNYIPVIGLEVHVGLKTKSKMFCGCGADWFGKEPNTLCCPVCLGLPGALPVPNRRAVEWCVMLGLALNCEIPELSKFDRKNYFYPDLPKGYQISQYDKPFAVNGQLVITRSPAFGGATLTPFARNDNKVIRIRRVHMEEDTGKLLHTTINGKKCTLIDFNRSGVPLVEVVTEPDIRSSEEAKIFLKKLHQIIRYLGISDADMEKGSMRCEPNISVLNLKSQISPAESAGKTTAQSLKLEETKNLEELELPPYKVEIKNINSFNFVKKAIDYEVQRQIEILKRGKIPVQETRGWDEKKGITYTQRIKEEASDYRYFPEPDIPPMRWQQSTINSLQLTIPELPDEKLNRFMRNYGLSEYDATILTETRETADYYEECVKNKTTTPKIIANWIINKKTDINKVSPENLASLITRQFQKPKISDEELEKIIKKVLAENSKAVSDYKAGRKQVLMFLIGQVLRKATGIIDAATVKERLIKLLTAYG